MTSPSSLWAQRASFAVTAIYIVATTIGAFAGGLWALLGIGGALLVFALIWLAKRRAPRFDRTLSLFVLSSLAIVALLNFQSSDAAVSWHMLLQQAMIMLPLLLWFSPDIAENVYSPRFFSRVVFAAFIGVSALAIEFALGGPLLRAVSLLHLAKGPSAYLFEYNRGVSYIAVMAMPLIGYLWIKGLRKEAILLIVILALPFSMTESRATKVAFILGLTVAGAAAFFPRLVKYSLATTLFASLAMPFAVTRLYLFHHDWINHLPPSWHNRVEIWDYMSYRIFDRPWLGWGMGTSRLLPYDQPHGSTYQYIASNAGHPHDAILHLWVEIGVPGVALGVIFALLMLYKASRFPKPIVPFAYGAWMAAFCISAVAYNFWDDSLFSLFALTAFAFILLERQTADLNLFRAKNIAFDRADRTAELQPVAMVERASPKKP
jgi:exopolysaccharide production protein ExoQ